MFKLIALLVLLFTSSVFAEDKIIKFYAKWCPPCHELSPRIRRIARQLDIRLDEVDIDILPDLMQSYNVDRIPTLVLTRDGKEVGRIIGALSDEELMSKIKSAFDIK